MAHVPRSRKPGHVRGVHQHLVLMVSARVMLLQAVMGRLLVVMVRRIMESPGPRMSERGPVVMPAIRVLRLALVARMRFLW